MNRICFAAAVALIASAAPAGAQARWDWSGGRPGSTDYRLVGPGVRFLYPELRGTMRGRAFVIRNFDRDRNRVISVSEARAANAAFAQIAGARRDRFDWDARDSGYVVVDRGDRGGAWDRGAMRGYGFRQTARGAMMRMGGDVLFATDSDVLRPGAVDKLRPLAAYLRANPGVRVAMTAIPIRAAPMRTTRTCRNAARPACAPRSTRWASPARASPSPDMAKPTRSRPTRPPTACASTAESK